MNSSHPLVGSGEPPRFVLQAWFDAFARRFPFVGLILAIFASNVAGSVFSFGYNTQLIVNRILNKPQREAFWDDAAPLYNVLAYPICIVMLIYLIWPVRRCQHQLRSGAVVDPAFLQFCRCRLVNFPI